MKSMARQEAHFSFVYTLGAAASVVIAALGVLVLTRPEILWRHYVDLITVDAIVLLAAAILEAGFLLAIKYWARARRIAYTRPFLTLCLPMAALGLIAFRIAGAFRPDVSGGEIIADVDPGSPVHLAFGGDIGRASDIVAGVSKGLLKLHAQHPYAAFFLAGDNIYGHKPYDEAFVKRIEHPLKSIFSAGIPVHVVFGSHDIRSGYAPSEMKEPKMGMGGHRYYEWSTRDGRVSVIAVDSERIESDPRQYRWVAAALKASRAQTTIFLSHDPLSASNILHGQDSGVVRLLMPLITSSDVNLLVSGENHIYERRHSADGRLAFVTVGSSGKVSHPQWPPDPLRDKFYIKAGSFLDITITPDKIVGIAMSSKGNPMDQFEKVKSPVAHSPG